MPGSNLVVHLAYPDRIGPEEQSAAITRKAEAVQPHHVDVARPVCFAFFQDLACLVDRRIQQPTQDLFVCEATLRDSEVRSDVLDNSGDFRIGAWCAVTLFVAIPASTGFLSVA